MELEVCPTMLGFYGAGDRNLGFGQTWQELSHLGHSPRPDVFAFHQPLKDFSLLILWVFSRPFCGFQPTTNTPVLRNRQVESPSSPAG